MMSAFTSTMLLNSLTWTDTCDVQKFVEKYSKHMLPCIVRVAEGFIGGEESQTTEFAQDEVYLVYEAKRQKRVIATDRNDKYVSIPLNYKTKFQVLEPGKPMTSAKPLKEICGQLENTRNADFRLENNASVSFSVGADMTDKRSLGLLRYDSTHSLKILLAYPIIDRQVLPKPIAIPSYVPLTLQVASGLVFGTQLDFEQFCQVASNGVKRFERLQIIREDIIITDELPEGDYEYVLLTPSEVAEKAENVANELRSSSPRFNATIGGRHHSSNDSYVLHNRSPPPPTPPRSNSTPSVIQSNKPFMLPQIPTSPSPVTLAQPAQIRHPPAVPPRRLRQPISSIDSDPTNGYLQVTQSDDDEAEDCPIISESPCIQNQSTSPDWVFGEIGLVPTNIASLSVEEISECLHYLHLDHYIEPFSQSDIDGQLLCCLNEHILKADFQFTDFQAKKLMKFATDGWRPLRRCATPDLV